MTRLSTYYQNAEKESGQMIWQDKEMAIRTENRTHPKTAVLPLMRRTRLNFAAAFGMCYYSERDAHCSAK